MVSRLWPPRQSKQRVQSKCNPLGRLGDSRRPADTFPPSTPPTHTEEQAGC